MAHNNQNLVLDNSETAQFLEFQSELNQDGSKRSLSQVVDYALRVAKAVPNADFRTDSTLFDDPFKTSLSNT